MAEEEDQVGVAGSCSQRTQIGIATSPSHSLHDWHALPLADRPRLVDVRSEEAFQARRLVSSINLPIDDLVNLLFELPEPSVDLAIVATNLEEGENAVKLLDSRYWHCIPFIFVEDESEENSVLWRSAATLRLLTSGQISPQDRRIIYTPNPFLVSHIDFVEESLAETHLVSSSQSFYTCCDVGCGAGRDSVWLAKRGRGWLVRCVDRLPRCLDRVQRLACRHGVSNLIECETSLVRGARVHSSSTSPSFETRKYDLVLAIRFFEREFLTSLGEMVRPGGGFLLFVSFVAREDGVAYEHPKDPKKVLLAGELVQVFGTGGMGFETVENCSQILPDGRVMSAYLARRL